MELLAQLPPPVVRSQPTNQQEINCISLRFQKYSSNWDRYEEEFGLGSEDSPQVSTSQASDVVVPKAYNNHTWQCAELQVGNLKNSDESEATGSSKGNENVFEGQAWGSISKEITTLHLSREYMSYNTSRSRCTAPTSTNHPVDDLNGSSGCTSENLTSGVSIDSVANKPSSFEAAKAEAELDMLLDSLVETEFFYSTWATEESGHTSYDLKVSTVQSVSVAAQHVREGSDVSHFGRVEATLDDTLDDLPKDASHPINTKGVSPLNEVKAASHDFPTASHPHSKSKILDDFDSWLNTT